MKKQEKKCICTKHEIEGCPQDFDKECDEDCEYCMELWDDALERDSYRW
jgi:hypothetical protein